MEIKRAGWLFLPMLCMVCLAASVSAQTASTNSGQAFPSRPIRLILPFPPGGNTDILGRIAGQKLSERLGQPVIADNRAGLGGYLGLEIASKAVPDGHTITIASMVYASGPLTYPDLKFNPEKELVAIGQLSEAPNIVVVHPSVPAKSLKELVDHVRANPKKLNFATSGTGSTLHLMAALLFTEAKMDVVHVPYKGGGGPAMNAVLSGEVQMIVLGPAAIPHIRSGKARALAVLSEQRIPVATDIPTAKEQGFNVVATSWHGLLAPAGTPRAIVNRINKEWVESAQGADVRERLEKLGFFPRPGTPEQFAALLRNETRRWARLIKEVGIQPER